MRTLGQKRAEFALAEILKVQDESLKKDFKNFSAGAPAMILQNGVGQALAFWIAKATDKNLKIKTNDKHYVLFKIVMDWLAYEKGDIKNTFVKKKPNTPKEFLEEISTLPQDKYLTAQKETLALLEWVKRYANAGL